MNPEQMARALLGPNATPDEIQQMLAALAAPPPQEGMPMRSPQTQVPPTGAPPDWTKGVAGNLSSTGVPKWMLPAAGLAAAPFLPAMGAMGGGGMLGALGLGAVGGAGNAMLSGSDPLQGAATGAALGGAGRLAAPYADKLAQLLASKGLGTNDALVGAASRGMGGVLSNPSTDPKLYRRPPLTPQAGEPVVKEVRDFPRPMDADSGSAATLNDRPPPSFGSSSVPPRPNDSEMAQMIEQIRGEMRQAQAGRSPVLGSRDSGMADNLRGMGPSDSELARFGSGHGDGVSPAPFSVHQSDAAGPSTMMYPPSLASDPIGSLKPPFAAQDSSLMSQPPSIAPDAAEPSFESLIRDLLSHMQARGSRPASFSLRHPGKP